MFHVDVGCLFHVGWVFDDFSSDPQGSSPGPCQQLRLPAVLLWPQLPALHAEAIPGDFRSNIRTIEKIDID